MLNCGLIQSDNMYDQAFICTVISIFRIVIIGFIGTGYFKPYESYN